MGSPTRTTTRVDGAMVSEVTLTKGEAEIFPAGVRVGQAFDVASEDLNVFLPVSFLQRMAEQAGADPDRTEVLSSFKLRDRPLERILLSFLPELETAGMGGELYAQGLANALAIHLLREHSSLGRSAKREIAGGEPTGGLSHSQLRRVTDYVDANLSGDLSLAELAAQANLSPYHFSRSFKRSTGLSPHQYVIRERVERAKRLLLNGELGVARVAKEVGFHDQSHLHRHLRRMLGATPSQILEQSKNVQRKRNNLQD
jgi:AraC family transcriptional regulator